MGGELKEKARPFLIKWTGDPKQGLTKTCRWPRQTNYLVFLQQPSDITDLSSAACGEGWWQIAVPGLHTQLSRTKALQVSTPLYIKAFYWLCFVAEIATPTPTSIVSSRYFLQLNPIPFLNTFLINGGFLFLFFPLCYFSGEHFSTSSRLYPGQLLASPPVNAALIPRKEDWVVQSSLSILRQ